VDITPQISESLLSQLGDVKEWRNRQQGMQSIRDLLTAANNRIQPKDGGLLEALKPRLHDSNSNQVQFALITVGQLVNAIGPKVGKLAPRYVFQR
jgi:hypothetical protein